jgi:hypothetical protein
MSVIRLYRTRMASTPKALWQTCPEEHDYPAALQYLSLVLPDGVAEATVRRLRLETTVRHDKAKDLIGAIRLRLLPVDNAHVAKGLRKVERGRALSPVLLVRGYGIPVIVADGYHRICTNEQLDPNALVPSLMAQVPLLGEDPETILADSTARLTETVAGVTGVPEGEVAVCQRHWKERPEDHHFSALRKHLCLLLPEDVVETLVQQMRTDASTRYYKVKDLLRASRLDLIPEDDPGVVKNVRRVRDGHQISPVLLVQGDARIGVPLLIGDGDRRISAIYRIDENATVRCLTVPLPRQPQSLARQSASRIIAA